MDNLKLKVIKAIIFIFIILVVILKVAPNFIDIGKYHPLLVDRIHNTTGKDVTVDGMSISFTPSLKIIIHNLTLADNIANKNITFLKAKNVIISVPLDKFIIGDLYFDRLEMEEAEINFAILPNQQKNWEFIKHISNNHSKLINLKSIIMSNSTIRHHLAGASSQVRNANLTIAFGNRGVMNVLGNFATDKNNLKIDFALDSYRNDQSQKARFHLLGNSIEMNFDGVLSILNNQNTIVGGVKAKISDPSILITNLAVTLPFLNELQLNSIDQPINIDSNLYISGENITATNIKIKSAHTNASGEVKFSLNSNLNLNVVLDFENLDMTKFISMENNSIEASSDKILVSNYASSNNMVKPYINFSYVDSEIMTLALTAKEITLPNIILQNFQLDFDTNNAHINKGNLAFSIKDDKYHTKVQLTNMSFQKLDNNNLLLSEFYNEGDNINETLKLFGLTDYIDIKEDDLNYNIYSKILFSPNEISIFDVKGKLGQAGIFSGNIAARKEETQNYLFDIKFDNLTLAKFDMPLFQERAHALFTKSKEDDYLSYFRWFRTLQSAYNIKFEFNNTSLQKEQIDNLKVFCTISPGVMMLKGSIKSPFAEGKYQMDLVAKAIKPIVNLDVTGSNLDFNRLKALVPNLLIEDNNIISQGNNNWSNQNFNLFRINKYVAKLNLALDNFTINSQNLAAFKFAAHTSGDVLNIDNLYFNIFSGQAQIRGNISFYDPLLYQFSFTTSGLAIKDLLANSFPEIKFIEGPISMAGSLITQGEDPATLVANMGSSSSFASPGMNIAGIDSDVLVDIALKREFIEKDQVFNAINTSLSTGTTEIKDISGNMKITKGILETNNTNFKTRFSSGVLGLSLNFNDLSMASNTKFLFQPYDQDRFVAYNVMVNGPFNSLKKTIEDADLIKYVKSKYNIVTQQDVIEAKKVEIKKQKNANEIGDEKNYLYYKLLEQNDANRIIASEPETSVGNNSNDNKQSNSTKNN